MFIITEQLQAKKFAKGERSVLSKVVLNTDNCKSCGYCTVACKQNALHISGTMNENGYNVVSIDESRCVGCGLCYTVCPDYVFNVFEEVL